MEQSEEPAATENNADWILDSLVAYLRGPIWIMPILNFVEQKSVVFEGDGAQYEKEYRQIHDEFRNLVDVMLGAYMDDLGLQPEHLEAALTQIQPSVRSAALQQLLEPVQSAGDFERFKLLMRTKNEQLHNEALEMLRQRRQNVKANASSEEFSEEDINEAIRQSLADHAAERTAQVAEKREVDRAMAASIAGLLKSQVDEENTTETNQIQTSTVQEELVHPSPAKVKAGVPDPEEVERRRNLLRIQRDKILSQKKKERELQLQQQEITDRNDTVGKTGAGITRPKSGRAARAALAGEVSPEVDERTIQYRRLLLQKIKEEVEGSPK